MNDFLLSTSGALDRIPNDGWESEHCPLTLPPILIALALSASSFIFFWLTWNTGLASLDVVVVVVVTAAFWSEDMKIRLIFRLKKRTISIAMVIYYRLEINEKRRRRRRPHHHHHNTDHDNNYTRKGKTENYIAKRNQMDKTLLANVVCRRRIELIRKNRDRQTEREKNE